MNTASISLFVGIILPISLVAYLLIRLLERYIPWIGKGGRGRQFVPVFTILLGTLLGAIPGLINGLASLVSPGAASIPYSTGVLLGLLGGLLAPTVYAWFHKVIRLK